VQAFLIRHPRPDVPPGVCYGATDLELAQNALDCATRLRARLPARIRLYSSPMRRCRYLAQILDPAARYDPRLREMDFGEWEMRDWSRIPRHELDAWAAAPMTFAPPGGESVAAVRARVITFLDERCQTDGEDIAVVTHAGVLRIIAGHLQELDQATWFNLQFGHGELTVLQVPAAADDRLRRVD
jgi:alpha-ribazole phosphatase